MALDLTVFNPMLKEHYAPLPVINLAFQKNKTMGLMKKKSRNTTSGGGKYWVQPVQTGLPGGGSSTFATAMAATNNNSTYEAFKPTRKRHYRKAQVDNETIEASATGNMDAFEPAMDEFDKAIEAEGNYLNFRLFRSGGGAIGRVTNTNLATTVIALDDAAGVWGARVGDILRLSVADGTSGALKAGTLTVASVQRRAGTITTTANISTGVATAATNDYIFLEGDFLGSGSGGAASGFIDWVPDADPGATPFYDVNRSTEPDYLGGLRVDGTDGRPLAEMLVDMVQEADNLGADPDLVIANPRALGTLTKQLDGKWVIIKAQGYDGKTADIGYKGWQVTMEGHEITIMSDRCCQTKRLWMLDSSTWTVFSAGPMPGFINRRTGSILKVSEQADAYEARIGEYWNVACKAPGFNVNGQI